MSNSNSDHTSEAPDGSNATRGPDVATQNDNGPDHASNDRGRVDISTADDVNVDEDNAIGSPKNSLTATKSNHTEDTTGVTSSIKNPGDEVTPDTAQTGKVPCEYCGGTGQLD